MHYYFPCCSCTQNSLREKQQQKISKQTPKITTKSSDIFSSIVSVSIWLPYHTSNKGSHIPAILYHRCGFSIIWFPIPAAVLLLNVNYTALKPLASLAVQFNFQQLSISYSSFLAFSLHPFVTISIANQLNSFHAFAFRNVPSPPDIPVLQSPILSLLLLLAALSHLILEEYHGKLVHSAPTVSWKKIPQSQISTSSSGNMLKNVNSSAWQRAPSFLLLHAMLSWVPVLQKRNGAPLEEVQQCGLQPFTHTFNINKDFPTDMNSQYCLLMQMYGSPELMFYFLFVFISCRINLQQV